MRRFVLLQAHCLDRAMCKLLTPRAIPSLNTHRRFSSAIHETEDDLVRITWKDKDGKVTITNSKVGQTLLNIARANNIDLEGACEGVCACSTCHVIIESLEQFDRLGEPSEEEEDMLDQAFGLTSTSRLGCQIVVTKADSGMQIQLPKATRNFYVDGHVPKPH